MNTAKAVILTTAGLIAAGLLLKKKAAGTLIYNPAWEKPQITFESGNPILTVGIDVQNTSNVRFTINSIAGNAYANNYLVGNISSFDQQIIEPNSESTLYIKIKLRIMSIVNSIIIAATTNNLSQVIQLDGFINVDNLQLPLQMEYKIGA